jgi:GNAT superfamily N-acetyltransferase
MLRRGAETLGPAALAYADANCFRAPAPDQCIERRSPHDDRVVALVEACGAADAGESGIVNSTSPLFTLEESGVAIAASGYTVWSQELAHVGVLVHPGWRGQGLARAVAAAAIAHALNADLVAQWRARLTLTASRQVARSLGFIELGWQLSLRLSPADA